MNVQANDYNTSHGKKSKKRGGRRKTAAEKEAEVPTEPKQDDEPTPCDPPVNVKKACHLPMVQSQRVVPKEDNEIRYVQAEIKPTDVTPFIKEDNVAWGNETINLPAITNWQEDSTGETYQQKSCPADTYQQESWPTDTYPQKYSAKETHQQESWSTNTNRQKYSDGEKYQQKNNDRNRGNFRGKGDDRRQYNTRGNDRPPNNTRGDDRHQNVTRGDDRRQNNSRDDDRRQNNTRGDDRRQNNSRDDDRRQNNNRGGDRPPNNDRVYSKDRSRGTTADNNYSKRKECGTRDGSPRKHRNDDNKWSRENSGERRSRNSSPIKYPGDKGRNITKQDHFRTIKNDDGFDDYTDNHRYATKEYKIVTEIEGDLFAMSTEYALGHCVAADMNMGSGIATTFRSTFKGVGELLEQRVDQGGVAFLQHEGRYIYYLVTKRNSSAKPTMNTMYRSVCALKERMREHRVLKLAIPRLGCGLDRLEWSEVKNMLEFVFEGTPVQIVVCNFQQAEQQMDVNESKHKMRKCYVTDSSVSITELDVYTIILYLGTENGYVDDVLEVIDKKYKVIVDYKNAKREMGKAVDKLSMGDNYMVCGCIARKTERDPVSYKALESAFWAVNKLNRSKKEFAYSYVAIPRYVFRGDELFMSKTTNLLRNTFQGVEVHIC